MDKETENLVQIWVTKRGRESLKLIAAMTGKTMIEAVSDLLNEAAQELYTVEWEQRKNE